MSRTLADALRDVDLEPGTYRAEVNGRRFEVHVEPAGPSVTPPPRQPAAPPADDADATPGLAEYGMLDPWFTAPDVPGGVILTVHRGDPFPIDPIVVDESDLAAE